MEECYYIDKYGAIKIKKLEELSIPYSELKCVLEGKSHIGYMYYPLIIASNKTKYLTQIKLALKAVKENIKYIELVDGSPDKSTVDEYEIIFYKYDKNKSKAILSSYLLKKYHELTKLDFNPIVYIINNLKWNDNYNKRFFMSRYINHILSDILPKEVEKINSNIKLSSKEKYMAKYHLAQNYDNFKLFKEMYQKVEIEASKILQKTSKDPHFIKYTKTVVIHNFEFSIKANIGDNPLYKDVKSNVQSYAKTLKVKIE